MRLRLGLLQDHAAIDRQIAREAAEAQAKKQKAEAPTVKTEAQTKADEAATIMEKEKGSSADKAKVIPPKPRIRPLSEAKAIDSGANFISEAFLFSVGLSLIIFESWRSRRKESSRREDVAGRIGELEREVLRLRGIVPPERDEEEVQTQPANVVSHGDFTPPSIQISRNQGKMRHLGYDGNGRAVQIMNTA